MEKNQIHIIMNNKIDNIKIPNDYYTFIKNLNRNNMDENCILCFDVKETFIINEENSFLKWKENTNYLGNYFLIINKKYIRNKENDILKKKKKIHTFLTNYRDLNNLNMILNSKKQEIKTLDEIKTNQIETLNKEKEAITQQLKKKEEELNNINNTIKITNQENSKIKNENKELKEKNKNIIQKIEYINKTINEKENEKKLKEIKITFDNQIQLILENYKKITSKFIVENLDKQFKIYIKELKNKEENRKNNYLKIENFINSTKNEINELFSSTQISHKVNCNQCNKDIKGIKYECSECNYNLCENCEIINFLNKKHPHKFYKIRKPFKTHSIKNE